MDDLARWKAMNDLARWKTMKAFCNEVPACSEIHTLQAICYGF